MSELSPTEVESVIEWLDHAGYARRNQQDGLGFGDHLEEWERGRQLVRLVRDRGQWFLDVGQSGWTDWFDIDLTAFVIGSRADSVVDRMAAAAEANLEHLLPALQEARRKQAEDRLGRLPPRHPYD